MKCPHFWVAPRITIIEGNFEGEAIGLLGSGIG